MTSLLDIGPLTEEVSISGKQVSVHGVTPEGFFYLLEKFPLLKSVFGGKAKSIGMDTLREVAPNCIAYVLAVATTARSDYDTTAKWLAALEATAKVATNLSAHYQVLVLQATLRLTFPDGIGPFMKGMGALADSINRVSGQAPDTTSSKPSRTGFVTESRGMRLGQGAPRESSVH